MKMGKTIFIIDDDEKLTELLTGYLARFGYRVESSADPLDGLARITRTRPDLVILDVMLPVIDGFEVCRRLRRGPAVPVIMLTARGDVADRIVGLELGADDYLPKPFEPRELVARIQSVLRRSGAPPAGEVIVHGSLSVDGARHEAFMAGAPLDLTTTEFELLFLFVRNPGVVLDRDRILEAVKGLDADSFDRSIDVMVSRLRAKMGDDPRHPVFLRTIRGAGYKFIGHAGGAAGGRS